MLGRVYIIQSPNTDKVYIGSTFETLEERFTQHKRPSNKTSSYLVIDEGNASIELLEEVKVVDKDELRLHEQRYIELYREFAVNRCNAFGIDKENIREYQKDYYEKHKAEISEMGKKYREDRRSEIKEKMKVYYSEHKDKFLEKFDCPCGGKYIKSTKSRHLKTQKHRTFLENLDQDKE